MTDRELLELAAKAAGIKYDPEASKSNPVSGAWFGLWLTYDREPTEHDRRRWNPLTDDGDALRLAAALRLSIDHNHPADQQRWVAADRNGCEGCYAPVSCVEDAFEDESHRMAATRRAIVRAAAEIGKGMA